MVPSRLENRHLREKQGLAWMPSGRPQAPRAAGQPMGR
jgi:hypothetical protein